MDDAKVTWPGPKAQCAGGGIRFRVKTKQSNQALHAKFCMQVWINRLVHLGVYIVLGGLLAARTWNQIMWNEHGEGDRFGGGSGIMRVSVCNPHHLFLCYQIPRRLFPLTARVCARVCAG